MSQDELAIRVVIDPTQFREELGRLRRDLEDQRRIDMDELREEREERYAPTPTEVEIREKTIGLDEDTTKRIDDVIGDVEELKRGLGLPAEFARLTPERLQEMVREAFKSGGFKDILERDPQMAEDIAWIVERGVARHAGEQMQEFEVEDPQTFGALQKILNTMMYKHPYGEGRRMQRWREWITGAIRQEAIGEVAVTEPQSPEERRAYMSMGHRAVQLDVQRLFGTMGKRAGLEFRLPFAGGERRLDVLTEYIAQSVATGEDVSALTFAEVKASGQAIGGTGGVAAQMAEQIRAAMSYLQNEVLQIDDYEEFKEFLSANRRVKGKGGESGIIKGVLASFKDVSLNKLITDIYRHLGAMTSPDEAKFIKKMMTGEKPAIEIATDIAPPELQKRFAELWDEGRRDVKDYMRVIAEFSTTPAGKDWVKDRLKAYNPTFSQESLDEIERMITGAAAFEGTEPERIEVMFDALTRLFEEEPTRTVIEGVSRFLDVPTAEAFPGIFARTVGGRAASVRALRGRIPGYLPGLAETLVEREERQVSELVGIRREIEEEERALPRLTPEVADRMMAEGYVSLFDEPPLPISDREGPEDEGERPVAPERPEFVTTGVPMEYDPKEYLAGMKKVAKGLGFRKWEDFTKIVEARSKGKLHEFLQDAVGHTLAVVGATLKRGAETGVFSKEQRISLSKMMAGTPQFWDLYQETPSMDPITGKPEAISRNIFVNELVKQRVGPGDIVQMGKELKKILENPEINVMLNQKDLTGLYTAAIQLKRAERATMDLEPAFGGALDYWT